MIAPPPPPPPPFPCHNRQVMAMIAIVRMAVALDRRNTALAVESVDVSSLPDGSIELALVPSKSEDGTSHDVSLEAWAAEQELRFMSKCIGQDVALVVPGINGAFWVETEASRHSDCMSSDEEDE